MAKKIKLILAALLAAVFMGSFPVSIASADDGAYEKQPTHLQVSPVKQKISLVPGSSYIGSFKVMNVGSMPFDYEVYATPYSVINDEYSPNYNNQTSYTKSPSGSNSIAPI